MPLESRFKERVRRKLNKIKDLEYFITQAVSVRGIPDVMICYKGTFVAWELKRGISELYYKDGRLKLKGRTVLQYKRIREIQKAGGIAKFVYPENFDDSLEELLSLNS